MYMTETVRKKIPPRSVEDVDLENRIARFLHQRHVPEEEQIRAQALKGTVVVSGRLHSQHAKWLCMECCRHVAGVIKLIDHVTVEPVAAERSQLPRHKSLALTIPKKPRGLGF